MRIELFALYFSGFGLIICMAISLYMDYLDQKTTRLLRETTIRDEEEE